MKPTKTKTIKAVKAWLRYSSETMKIVDETLSGDWVLHRKKPKKFASHFVVIPVMVTPIVKKGNQ